MALHEVAGLETQRLVAARHIDRNFSVGTAASHDSRAHEQHGGY